MLAHLKVAAGRRAAVPEAGAVPAQSTSALARAGRWGWLGAALLLSLLFALRALGPALGPGQVVQDDARQHVFWMARFRDPELFRDDLITDYYQSLAPPGYAAVYWALAWLVDPLLASKLVPPILGVIAALFTFLATRSVYPASGAAFLASLLLSYYVWQYDDLVSAVPRAFVLPLLSALLWALLSRRTFIAAVVVVLLGLFYPMGGALGVAILALGLVRLERRRPRLSDRRADWIAFIGAVLLVGLTLLQGQLIGARFGPVVTAAEAQTMPDFGPNGRVPIFADDPYRYWLKNRDSGLDLQATDLVLKVPLLFDYAVLALLLPALRMLRGRVPSAARLNLIFPVLARVLAASFGLFLLAHLLLFRLYLPSRYVKWSVPLVLAVAGGLALGILADEAARRWSGQRRDFVAAALVLSLGLLLCVYPAHYDNAYKSDLHPRITALLKSLPKDILVAGVPIDTDNVPAFSGRRVLTNREHTYPLHLGFNREMGQRTEALIAAYYADSLGPVLDFAARYGVTHFLVNRDAFQASKFGEAWRDRPDSKWQPFHSEVAAQLQRSKRFILLDQVDRCALADDGVLAALATSCLTGGR